MAREERQSHLPERLALLFYRGWVMATLAVVGVLIGTLAVAFVGALIVGFG